MNRISNKIIQILILVFIVLLGIYPLSCRLNEEGISLITVESTSPVINSYSVNSEDRISICFSEKVQILESMIFDDSGNFGHSVIFDECDSGENFKVDFKLDNGLEIGKNYELYGVVKDKNENSLTYCLSFVGFNSRVPDLRITEIRPNYASSTKTISENGEKRKVKVYKAEFVEIQILSDGNLCGIQLFSGNDGEERKITLPAVEVKKNDIILIHPRTHSAETGAFSELEDDLTVSKGYYSSDFARDIWFENENSCFGDEQDVIVIKDSQSGKILDCVLYNSSKKIEVIDWKKEYSNVLLSEIWSEKKWEDFSIDKNNYSVFDAFDCIGLTSTKSIRRIDKNNKKSSFIVSKSSKENPGEIDEHLKN